jgi:hypothetical protein
MIKTLDSYSTLLKLLTNTFLLEEPLHRISHEKIKDAVAAHQASFIQLKKNLAEARSERLHDGAGIRRGRRGTEKPFEDAVDSLTRLGQHLNGLRSGITLQYDISKAYRDGKLAMKKRSFRGKPRISVFDDGKGKMQANGAGEDEEDVMIKSVAAMFGDLVDELGPPLHALTVCFSLYFR